MSDPKDPATAKRFPAGLISSGGDPVADAGKAAESGSATPDADPADPADPAEQPDRPVRRYQAAVSAGAMALAWANQEKAPTGAIVVVTHEVSPMGRLGQLWPVAAASTLAFSVVLRPELRAEEADVPWILAALAVAEGIEAAGRPKVLTSWPDQVVGAEDGQTRAAIRAEVQLGPGKVRVAVATVRIDLTDDPVDRDELLEAIGTRFDQRNAELAEGVAGPVAAYERRCATLGRNLKIKLVPRGELRAHAAAIDPLGRLECRSPSGMVEHVSVNQVRQVELL